MMTGLFVFLVFSLVSSVAMVHACREAMRMLRKTGTDFSTAKGMDPKQFFEVMGMSIRAVLNVSADSIMQG